MSTWTHKALETKPLSEPLRERSILEAAIDLHFFSDLALLNLETLLTNYGLGKSGKAKTKDYGYR